MTAFVITAAFLALATAALVARSLTRTQAAGAAADELNAAVYRDQLAELDAALAEGSLTPERHAEAREGIRARLAAELSHGASRARALASSRLAAFGAAAAIVVFGVALYAWRGTPQALDPKAQVAAQDEGAHGLQGQQIAGMVERLAARLQQNPDDLNGWVMLGRSYSAMGRFDMAARAYGKAIELAPQDAALLADGADVIAMAQGRKFDGEPDRLIARALAADPDHVKALALAGSAAFSRGDYPKAVELWTRLRGAVPADSDMARSIEVSIEQARGKAGMAAAATVQVVPGKPAAGEVARPASAGKVAGVVTLAAALADRVGPNDTLFIYARAPEGSRMPLAILKRPVGTWPVAFTLDDTLAMSPAGKLSGAQRVVVEARVSRSGSATPAPGDLRGASATVDVGRADLRIEIGALVP